MHKKIKMLFFQSWFLFLVLILGVYAEGKEIERPKRLCYDLLDQRDLPKSSLIIPGSSFEIVSPIPNWRKEGESLIVSSGNFRNVSLSYRFNHPIRLDDYERLVIWLSVAEKCTMTLYIQDESDNNNIVGNEIILSGDKSVYYAELLYLYSLVSFSTRCFGMGSGIKIVISSQSNRIGRLEIRAIEFVPKTRKEPLVFRLGSTSLYGIWEKQVRWYVKILPGDVLDFGTGFFKRSPQEISNLPSLGVRYKISFRWVEGKEKDENIVLFDCMFEESNFGRLVEEGWIFHKLDLSMLAWKEGEIIFTTEMLGETGIGYPLWGNPIIKNFTEQGYKEDLPPIFLISCDTLRPQNLTIYGYDKPTSYYLEKFSRDFVIFHRAYTPRTFTPVAHMSLLTGLEPDSHGLVNAVAKAKESAIQISEILQRDFGYITGGFVGFAYWFRNEIGFGNGCDIYKLPSRMVRYEDIFTVKEKVVNWVEENRNGLLFLFWHNYDIHSKMFPRNQIYDSNDCRFKFFSDQIPMPEEFRIECLSNNPRSIFDIISSRLFMERKHITLSRHEDLYLKASYDDCVAKVDYAIGSFLGKIKDIGLYDKSIIVIVSDHGESLGEHGRYEHDNTYEEVSRVVMLMKFPHEQFGGKEIFEIVSLTDVVPTIMDYLGCLSRYKFDGESLLPLIKDEGTVREYLISKNRSETETAIITKDYKYVLSKLFNVQEKEKLFKFPFSEEDTYDIAEKDEGLLRVMRDKLKKIESKQEEGYIMWIKVARAPEVIEFTLAPNSMLRKVVTYGSAIITQEERDPKNPNYVNFKICIDSSSGSLARILIIPLDFEKDLHIYFPEAIDSYIVLPDESTVNLREVKEVCLTDSNIIWERGPIFNKKEGRCLAFQRFQKVREEDKVSLPKEVEDTLRSLGYLQ